MLQGCQGPLGGETRDPAWQPGHNEQENTLVYPLMFQQQSTFVPLILIPQATLVIFFVFIVVPYVWLILIFIYLLFQYQKSFHYVK